MSLPPPYSHIDHNPTRYAVSEGQVFPVHRADQLLAAPQQSVGHLQTNIPQQSLRQAYPPYTPMYPPFQHTQSFIPGTYPYGTFASNMQPYAAPPMYQQPQFPQPTFQQPAYQQPAYCQLPLGALVPQPPGYHQAPPALEPTQSFYYHQSPDIPPPPAGYTLIPGTNYAVPSEWLRGEGEEDNAELKKFMKGLLQGMDGNQKKMLKRAIRASQFILRDLCA